MSSIVLGFALFFTFLSVETLAIDLVLIKDKNANNRLVSKILACICWGLYHFLIH